MNYSIDGNQVCCTAPHFRNLQEDTAGFGDSLELAFIDYCKNNRKLPRERDMKSWELPWLLALKDNGEYYNA